MKQLPQWMTELQARKDGESAGHHLARIVRSVVGLSLVNNRQRLEELFLANEPTMEAARNAAALKTNCGTSMRAIYALAGCDHPLVTCPMPPTGGTAITWLLIAAREKGALVTAKSWEKSGPGWGMHYATAGKTDDHVEWLLDSPGPTGLAIHAGGGKPNNEIVMRGPDDIRWSTGRPLVHMFDPEPMLRPASKEGPKTGCEVQAALNALGFGPLVVDGSIGPKTTSALKAFQRAYHIPESGVVTDETRLAMKRWIAEVS